MPIPYYRILITSNYNDKLLAVDLLICKYQFLQIIESNVSLNLLEEAYTIILVCRRFTRRLHISRASILERLDFNRN